MKKYVIALSIILIGMSCRIEEKERKGPLHIVSTTGIIEDAIENGGLSIPFVWKSARFGYDGQGVKVIRNISDLKDLPNTECIAEALIPFKNELAVIVARNESGEIKTYPTVEMEFHPEANQVEYVLCPARLPDNITKKAEDLALKVADAYKHVGLLAVEMFLTKDDGKGMVSSETVSSKVPFLARSSAWVLPKRP